DRHGLPDHAHRGGHVDDPVRPSHFRNSRAPPGREAMIERTLPMANHLVIGILNGDDIGHEIVPAAVDVVRAAAARTGLDIDWRPMPIGRSALDTHGSTFPEGTMETLAG